MFQFLICFIAGIGAGLGTGFAGMSAAAVISPMLITFLGLPAYEAVGIALASDVLASAVSAYTYGKNKNLDIKNGIVMMVTVLLFTLAGSFVASLVPNTTMGSFSVFMTLLLGIKFIIKPVMTTKESMSTVSVGKRIFQSVLSGIIVGFICGFVGAGGGMMMLLLHVYHDLHRPHRLPQPLCHRRHAEHSLFGFLCGIHPSLGQNCRKVCKQSLGCYIKPRHRRCTYDSGYFHSHCELFTIKQEP